MVSSKVSKHVKLFLLFVFGDHFMNILILFLSSSNQNEFVVLLDIQQFSLFLRDDLNPSLLRFFSYRFWLMF